MIDGHRRLRLADESDADGRGFGRHAVPLLTPAVRYRARGVLMFGERLDQTMWIGSGLIVASGLYILWRGRRA